MFNLEYHLFSLILRLYFTIVIYRFLGSQFLCLQEDHSVFGLCKSHADVMRNIILVSVIFQQIKNGGQFGYKIYLFLSVNWSYRIFAFIMD